jgi:hypothetical protein
LPRTPTSPQPIAGDAFPPEPPPSTWNKIGALAGFLALALTAAAFVVTARVGSRFTHTISVTDFRYGRASLRSYEILLGGLAAAFLLQPLGANLLAVLRRHWRPAYTWVALAAACVFQAVFILHAGRHQLGGFDFSILTEIGWRQFLGQRPYVDFPVPTPPGFNLGIKYAFQLFGATWDANLYFTSLFACATLLWIYWLMLQLEFNRLAALATAFAIECQAMLLLSFWWYNNTAIILSAVFLLACLVYARRPRSAAVQLSYFTALTLLALMKPNIAGVAIAGGIVLLLIATDRRLRLVLLTLAAAAAVLAIFAVCRISIPAMLFNYREVTKDRGGLSIFGYLQLGDFEEAAAVRWFIALSLPWLWLLPRTFRLLRQKDFRGVALHLFFPLALLVSVYGLMTNGDFWQVECPPLLALAAVLTFAMRVPPPLIRRLFTAMLCAGIASNLYIGVARLRVYTIGPGLFFEWTGNQNRIPSGALKGMRVGDLILHVQQQIAQVMSSNPGSTFFGPRIDFNYPVQGVPAPGHFPAWWHPGTAFGREQVPQFVQVWKDHRFQTLIFLKDDYTMFPPELMAAIANGYLRDDRYPDITVYHRRPAATAP